MSFDLFGHGPRLLPFDDDYNFSDGPDRKRGPSKCRGVEGGCYDGYTPTPHDHSCCCDPCRHTFVNVCGQHCCRCVPKHICAVFTPHTIEGRCKQRVWRLTAVTTDEQRERTYYSFQTGAGEIELSVGYESYPDYDYSTCSWRLESYDFGISEVAYIDHSGPVHCQAPPAFVIEDIDLPVTVNGSPVSCVGNITFQSSPEHKVPFKYRWEYVAETISATCGYCTEFCTVLCIKRGNEYESDFTRTEFVFDGTDRFTATDRSGHYFELVEEYGQCYIKLTEVGIETLRDDLIEIDSTACALGMVLSAVDYDGNYIKISCNPCSCWSYICGSCRCLCPNLCMTGLADGQAIEPTVLAWDKDRLRWGDEYFSVTPETDDYGNCVASVTGYADPVPMGNECGSDIAFQISQSLEEQLENGVTNFLSFRCADCVGGCEAGSCLDECEEVPSVLFAELSAAPWDEMLGCNDAVRCFETIIIPLVQVFVSTNNNPAGEYRWIGSGIISCRSCLSNTTPTNHSVQVDIGCDGIGTLTVSDGTLTCQFQLNFTLPCNGQEWDLQFDPFLDCDVLPGCCDVGGFVLGITE